MLHCVDDGCCVEGRVMGSGDLVVPEGALLLAPMRMVAREFGAWRTFTEMVSAEELKYRS